MCVIMILSTNIQCLFCNSLVKWKMSLYLLWLLRHRNMPDVTKGFYNIRHVTLFWNLDHLICFLEVDSCHSFFCVHSLAWFVDFVLRHKNRFKKPQHQLDKLPITKMCPFVPLASAFTTYQGWQWVYSKLRYLHNVMPSNVNESLHMFTKQIGSYTLIPS